MRHTATRAFYALVFVMVAAVGTGLPWVHADTGTVAWTVTPSPAAVGTPFHVHITNTGPAGTTINPVRLTVTKPDGTTEVLFDFPAQGTVVQIGVEMNGEGPGDQVGTYVFTFTYGDPTIETRSGIRTSSGSAGGSSVGGLAEPVDPASLHRDGASPFAVPPDVIVACVVLVVAASAGIGARLWRRARDRHMP